METTFQIDTPLCTAEEFHRRSGIPQKTVINRMANGEIPEISLGLDPDRKSTKYVNLVLLYQICAAQEFNHPVLKVA